MTEPQVTAAVCASPAVVLAIAFLGGLIKPSDIVMRNSLIGDTMPSGRLANALGLSRTTMDSARIVGALTGAGLFSVLGIGYAYIVVTAFYALSFAFTLGVSGGLPADAGARSVAMLRSGIDSGSG